jgi:hypothetical protein
MPAIVARAIPGDAWTGLASNSKQASVLTFYTGCEVKE